MEVHQLELLLEYVPGILKKLRKLVEVSDAKGVARRLFVTNSFDCLLTSLGVILGGYAGGIASPKAYIGTVLGGSLTMGIFSGFVGAFFSERAERLRELKRLQFQVQSDLSKSVYGKASKWIPIYVALWSALGMILFPLIIIIPFLFAWKGLIGLKEGIFASILLINISVFSLGVYLGGVSGENRVKTGLTMLTSSVSATLLLMTIAAVVK